MPETNSIPAGCLWTILGPNAAKKGHVLCRCSCPAATEKSVWKYDIFSGRSVSCGCHRKALLTKHGRSKTRGPTYTTWNAMMDRCNNANNPNYHLYGGRGIKVCDRWRDFNTFLADMGERTSTKHSLDRIDTDGDYSPENCRWATPQEQARNMRHNANLTLNGRTMCMSAWAEELGIPRTVLEGRKRRGWSDERALTEPVSETRQRAAKGGIQLTYNGKTQRPPEWAKELGIPLPTIYSRIQMGWPVERVLGSYDHKRDPPPIPLAPPPPAG